MTLPKNHKHIKNEDELINIIEQSLSDPFNKGKKLWQVLHEQGIRDTMQLADRRTLSIIEEYHYYKYPGAGKAPYDSMIWKESVKLLTRIEPRLI